MLFHKIQMNTHCGYRIVPRMAQNKNKTSTIKLIGQFILGYMFYV